MIEILYVFLQVCIVLSVFTGMLKKLNFGKGGRESKQTGSTSVGAGAVAMEAKA